MLNSCILFFVKEEELYKHIEKWKYLIKLLFYVTIIKSVIESLQYRMNRYSNVYENSDKIRKSYN